MEHVRAKLEDGLSDEFVEALVQDRSKAASLALSELLKLLEGSENGEESEAVKSAQRGSDADVEVKENV